MADAPLRQLSVKVDVATHEAVERRIKELGAPTVSDYLRRLIRKDLGFESDIALLARQIAGQDHSLRLTKQQVTELRRDLAAAVEAILLLTAAGQKATPDEVLAWVQEILRDHL